MNDDQTREAALQSPRKLGDQWENWNGAMEENNGDLHTSPWYFIVSSLLAVMVVNIVSLFLMYMIKPRLTSIHSLVHAGVSYAVVLFLIVLDVSAFLILATVLTRKPFAFFLKNKEITNLPFVNLAIKIGRIFGLSKDRFTNSMLQTNNLITRALHTGVHPDDLLILVPRCLSRFTRTEMTALTEKYGVTFFTAGGGNAAREILVKRKPKAVIAVACERDLLAGVKDVKGKIPVIAIANKRPEGPCKNTFIDFKEMEDAICHFLNPSRHIDNKETFEI
jgi:hypothetical protein